MAAFFPLASSRKTNMHPQQIAELVLAAYRAYQRDFRALTQGAKARFQARDWKGMQADSQARLQLYKSQVSQTAAQLKQQLPAGEGEFWQRAKAAYEALTQGDDLGNLAQTFYNSVFRKAFAGIGADRDCMFVLCPETNAPVPQAEPRMRRYDLPPAAEPVLAQMLKAFELEVPFRDLAADLSEIQARLSPLLEGQARGGVLEMLTPVFYRNKGAYLVGRLRLDRGYHPFVLALLHEEEGLFVDTLLLDSDSLSIVFSFTRSYFMADLAMPSEVVAFLRTLMPLKKTGELYNSIGYNKHGKTELYRDFLAHLAKSDDQFVVAPGIRGMVMSVFTLPSYNIVFKLIKDRFPPVKTVTRQEVKSKYKLVSLYDRVGRMADTHEFEHFTFPRDRFSPELLAELLEVAASTVQVTETEVHISHLYTERRMTPLNLYLETASPHEAAEAIDEYGNAIKQLASANIFPGDMLLKNFGVTRHGRVVFYDYDEIGFLTDYRFRYLPEADEEDEMRGGAWFSVEPNDVFPEEFRRFLIGRQEIREIFFERHAELFDAQFWRGLQKRLTSGEVMDFFPYRRWKRFHQGEAPAQA